MYIIEKKNSEQGPRTNKKAPSSRDEAILTLLRGTTLMTKPEKAALPLVCALSGAPVCSYYFRHIHSQVIFTCFAPDRASTIPDSL